MNTVGTYLLYLLISTGLTVLVGTGLARSGRAFLLDVFGGDDALARAVSRLLVLGFYLLSLGFVALTMRTGDDIASARAGLQLLSVKVGEVLLVLGVLPLITLAALARTRRRAQARAPGQPPGKASAAHPPQPEPPGPAQPGATHASPAQPAQVPVGPAPMAGPVLQ